MESQLFTQGVSSLACFFISLAAYAGLQFLQAVLFSSYLVHKTTAVVPGFPSGDRGNWEQELLCDRSHACFAKKA